jgi:hypothetical protein
VVVAVVDGAVIGPSGPRGPRGWRRNSTDGVCVLCVTTACRSYSFNGPPQPCLLDAASVRADTILLLDTFFQVVVFHGETIAAWREQKYHEREEHDAFRKLLAAPTDDARIILDSRFPVRAAGYASHELNVLGPLHDRYAMPGMASSST